MGIDQWEWEEMRILIVFPHTSTLEMLRDKVLVIKCYTNFLLYFSNCRPILYNV